MGLILKRILVSQLQAGMVLGETVYDESGNVLLAKGLELRHAYIDRIVAYGIREILVSEASKTTTPELVTASSADPVLNMMNRDIIVSETRQEASQLVRHFMESFDLKTGTPNIDKVLLIVNQLIDEILKNEDVAFNLGDLKSVDDYTFEHSVNVCVLSLMTGISYGLRKVALLELGVGAILHDIGKIMIPQEVLNKPGLLSDDEFEMVKRHARLGYDVLTRIKGVSMASSTVALYHHERYDGNGYPAGLSRDEIPAYCRIAALADVFDALTSDRVYSKKISPYKAMEYVVSMVGAHFDPEIVRSFARYVGFYYRGLRIELNTGELAVVTHPQNSRPIVRVLADVHGMELQHVYEIDLLKNPTVQVRNIIFPDEYLDGEGVRGKTS